jgi:hypothetical protein
LPGARGLRGRSTVGFRVRPGNRTRMASSGSCPEPLQERCPRLPSSQSRPTSGLERREQARRAPDHPSRPQTSRRSPAALTWSRETAHLDGSGGGIGDRFRCAGSADRRAPSGEPASGAISSGERSMRSPCGQVVPTRTAIAACGPGSRRRVARELDEGRISSPRPGWPNRAMMSHPSRDVALPQSLDGSGARAPSQPRAAGRPARSPEDAKSASMASRARSTGTAHTAVSMAWASPPAPSSAQAPAVSAVIRLDLSRRIHHSGKDPSLVHENAARARSSISGAGWACGMGVASARTGNHSSNAVLIVRRWPVIPQSSNCSSVASRTQSDRRSRQALRRGMQDPSSLPRLCWRPRGSQSRARLAGQPPSPERCPVAPAEQPVRPTPPAVARRAAVPDVRVDDGNVPWCSTINAVTSRGR